MSFMFNPHPFDDPNAINTIQDGSKINEGIVSGFKASAFKLADDLLTRFQSAKQPIRIVVGLDGYASARFEPFVNLLSQQLSGKQIKIKAIDVAGFVKSSAELDEILKENLEEDREKDPILLYGKLFKGHYEDLMNMPQVEAFASELDGPAASAELVIVYGCGAAIETLRKHFDLLLYFDVTPKCAILRARAGEFANFGDSLARPIRPLLRRCYYVDFEIAGHLRGDLLKNKAIDFYVASDREADFKMLTREAFDVLCERLVKQPFRCRPVYLEGVWGGSYITRLRNLPKSMRNCAWVFDLIPLEVSIVAKTDAYEVEMPYFTLVQKEGVNIMGAECVKQYGGYFPIRFNYDDTYHSSGNMSIQVHSGHDYNVKNFNEFGRQDESYYIVATGHGAKTYVGFTETASPDEFIQEIKRSEKEFTPVDYQKYVNAVESKPGVQVMLPAGTIHSSGRNQVILEIGSLSIGSYTYKLYDYLRADLDGTPRPIHSWHGERVLEKSRTTSWVNDNIVRPAQVVRQGEGFSEEVVGEHDLLYFSLRRLNFEKEIRDNTNGKFHVLSLVDGEKVRIQSLSNPALYFDQNYLDVVVVPANMGEYVIKNLGDHPISIHKTCLK